MTGFPPGTVTNGTIHLNDAVAMGAQSDATSAYNRISSRPCDTDLSGQDLGGRTLTPGVYCFSSSAQLTGTLTLDAGGDSKAAFIFKTGSTLTTAANSNVMLINGANPCNGYFRVGSFATLGTDSMFTGTIVAQDSITATTRASVTGRLLARTGAVTLDDNTVNRAPCPSTVTNVNPDVGPSAGGTVVTITGFDFTGATQVEFGPGHPATSFTVDSDTQITATAPPHTPGSRFSVSILVTTSGGTSNFALASRFTYIGPPEVATVSPRTGPTAGGNTVVVSGKNFIGVTGVSFGGKPAPSFTVNTPTRITIVAPPGSVGTVDIVVTTLYGTSTTSAADRYSYA